MHYNLLFMFQTNQTTTVVSSTDLKRQYPKVKNLLKGFHIVMVTNKKSQDEVDGVFIPYSPSLIEHLEDFLEDLEISKNREALDAELLESLQSGKGKRIPLDEVTL